MSGMDREQLEEIAVAGRDIARMTKAQFEAFREAGFGKGDAMALTMHWMSIVLGQQSGPEQDDGET